MDASGDLRTQRILRVTAVAIGCLAYWRLLFWGAAWTPFHLTTWFFFPTDPFPQVIFLVTAALVYRRRNYLRSAMRYRGSLALAALPLLAGVLLFAWGHYVNEMGLVLVSFMLVSLGIGLLWFGARFARALAIPWVVLAFAFPSPAVLTNQAFYALRLWTASHTTALLQLAGIPVLREGNVIFGSKMIAHVVDSCSGFRSMQMLTLAGIFYVSWFPARRVRQGLLVILAPAIAYLFNLLRVGVIAVAPTSEYSTAHTVQGLTVFLGAITSLIIADRILGLLLPGRPKAGSASRPPEVEPEAEQPPQPGVEQPSQLEAEREPQPEAERETPEGEEPASATPSQGSARATGRLGAAALVVLAVAMLGVSIWMPRWHLPRPGILIPAELPAEFDGWTQVHEVKPDSGYLWTVRFPKHESWIYERDGEEMSVFIGYDFRRSRGQSLISRKNALPGRGWGVEERGSVSLEDVEARVERVVARSQSDQFLTYHWYEGTAGLASETLRELFSADQSLFRRPGNARVIRVATALGPTPLGRMEGEAKLRGFAASVVAALRE